MNTQMEEKGTPNYFCNLKQHEFQNENLHFKGK